jgi:hypothetical protein
LGGDRYINGFGDSDSFTDIYIYILQTHKAVYVRYIQVVICQSNSIKFEIEKGRDHIPMSDSKNRGFTSYYNVHRNTDPTIA